MSNIWMRSNFGLFLAIGTHCGSYSRPCFDHRSGSSPDLIRPKRSPVYPFRNINAHVNISLHPHQELGASNTWAGGDENVFWERWHFIVNLRTTAPDLAPVVGPAPGLPLLSANLLRQSSTQSPFKPI
jgi:hypothetical protein